MIQEPVTAPVSRRLVSPQLEQISPAQEKRQADAGAAPQDNGMSKSTTTQDEHLKVESSTQISPTQTNESKKAIEE
jgi:hypothetical protein